MAKKLVTLHIVQTVKVEVEVDFPIYREHVIDNEGGTTTFYSRIDETGAQLTVGKYHHWAGPTHYDLEHKSDGLSGSSSEDYMLGKGEYACTAEEFDEALAEAVAAILGKPA